MVSLIGTIAAPEELPGMRMIGFECCQCNGVSLTNMLVDELGLSIVLPFALNAADNVQSLLAELEATSYGPRIRVERESKKPLKNGERQAGDYVNENWEKACKNWTGDDSV
ncbi:hypothetical protein VM1G_11995 [Cytospora mali]|uniref:Uncharacterized protein n=1 Tax=Cytospora mali TaxID=578113 RepID=A0A194VHU5_CYTMA|nr:hypothetical protein VM1G_11995 [Valsa mali]